MTHEEALEAATSELLDYGEFGTTVEEHIRNCRRAAKATVSAYLSSLSPDVGELCERLKKTLCDYQDLLTTRQAADMLTALSAKLGVAERELGATVRKFNCDNADQFWENISKLRARAEAAEAENARLREALQKVQNWPASDKKGGVWKTVFDIRAFCAAALATRKDQS